MSWERSNQPMFRSGYGFYGQATNPVSAGDTGLYFDSTTFTMYRVCADGTLMALQPRVIPAARVAFSVNPTANDTITIGGSSFTFKSSLGAATTTTQVKILGTAALTLAALLDAINGVSNTNVVLNTTPFTTSIVADAVSATVLRIRKAASQGGTAVAGTVGSTALAASISGGASAWSAANLNVSGGFPKITVTAAMVTNGSFQVELDCTPNAVMWQVASSAGVQRAITDAVTISGNAINLALAGGASPATQATDTFTFQAF